MSSDKGRVYTKPDPVNVAIRKKQEAKMAESEAFDERAKEGMSALRSSLIPKGGESKKDGGPNTEEMLKKMEDNYDKKLGDLADAFKSSSADMSDHIRTLNERIGSLGKSNGGMRKAMGEMDSRYGRAMNSLADNIKKSRSGSETPKPKTGKPGGVSWDGTKFYVPGKKDINSGPADPLTVDIPDAKDNLIENPNAVVKEEEVIEEAAEIRSFQPVLWEATDDMPYDDKTMQKGKYYKVGKYELRTTNLFGYRTGGNKVAGRVGRHSSGIDYVERNGNAVAIDDGVVISVTSQGNPYVRRPDKIEKNGKQTPASGGWIVTIRNKETGLYTKYMHMDKFTTEDIKNLVGKELKRGDKFWTAKIGSGTQTGPHVKVAQYMDPGKYGEQRKKYNPSIFITGGKK